MKAKLNWSRVAILLWLIPMTVIAISIIVHPLNRSMTPIYHDAVVNWDAHRPIYTGTHGFNYLPVFVPFFSIFTRLPLVVCEISWRLIALIGLYFGLLRCTKSLTTINCPRAFTIITLLTLPMSLSAFRNGQSSAQLAASLVLAACCLKDQHWSWATLWLCLALVCKPLAIPAIGLAVMMFPRIWWRMILGALFVSAAPYLLAPASYANGLYVSFVGNIIDCFDPGSRTFADLNGVLMVLDLKLTGMTSLMVRIAAGGAMAIGCLLARNYGSDMWRTMLWLGLSAGYIMLFTPMNEANSYVILAPSLGLWAWWHFENGSPWTAKFIGLMCGLMVFLPDIVALVLGQLYGNEFAKFLYPLITLIFLGILLQQLNSKSTEIAL